MDSDVRALREQAQKYRRLAASITHRETVELLDRLAAEVDAEIERILGGRSCRAAPSDNAGR